MSEQKKLKKSLILTFVIIIILIFCSGALGWILTQRIEKNEKAINAVHFLKESELQLRREEKNLLLRGYSDQRYLRWQKAKEDFHEWLGELDGLDALQGSENNELKTDHSENSNTYHKFFENIRSGSLSETEIAGYDEQFKIIGRRTLKTINTILSREQIVSSKTDSMSNILILAFLIIFITSTVFLIINVIKHI